MAAGLLLSAACTDKRVERGEELAARVEASLDCLPHLNGSCERLPRGEKDAPAEEKMPWRKVLHAEEQEDGEIEALVLREEGGRGGQSTLWRYRFSLQGEFLSGACLPDLPLPQTPLGKVRMPERLSETQELRYADRCRESRYGGWIFSPGPDDLGPEKPNEPLGVNGIGSRSETNTWVQGLPQTLRSRKLDRTFPPFLLPLSGQKIRLLSLEGEGWEAEPRVAELLHLLTPTPPVPSLTVFSLPSFCRSLHPLGLFGGNPIPQAVVEQEKRRKARELECSRLAITGSAISSHWIDWIRQKEAQGEAEARPLLQSDELDGHTIGLGLESKLLLEVDGVPLIFETQRSAGVRLIFDGGLGMDAAWRDFGELLRADGVEEAVIAAPPWYLTGDRLYRVEEAGAALACERVELVDACSGKCSEARKVAADFDGSSLYLPWAGGVKVGRCVEGGKG